MSESANDPWPEEPIFEPPFPDPETDGTSAVEYLDGSASHDLFTDVHIVESENGVGFYVPPRIVMAPGIGKLLLRVYGSRTWFKEPDDYGEHRFVRGTADKEGVSIWIPHLYPFEEADEHGLPLIRDVERCSLTVTLQGFAARGEMPPLEVAITTPYDTVAAEEDPDSFGYEGAYAFVVFGSLTRPLWAQAVKYPELHYPSLRDYLMATDRLHEYGEILNQQLPMPEEFEKQFKPNDWSERDRAPVMGNAFGTVWVPMTRLHTGIDATISFPTFQ